MKTKIEMIIKMKQNQLKQKRMKTHFYLIKPNQSLKI